MPLDFRDTHKTVGAIRGAAFDLCQALLGTPHHDAAAELHDSICRALPGDNDRTAAEVREALNEV